MPDEFSEPLYFDDAAKLGRDARAGGGMELGRAREMAGHAATALGGKSPREAVGVPERQRWRRRSTSSTPRASRDDSRRRALRAEYQLPAVAPIHADAGTNVSMLSFAQSLRIELASLTPEQLDQVTQRALLMRYPGFAYAVLTFVIGQGSEVKPEQQQAFYLVLSQICDDAYRAEEALQWIARGLATVGEGLHRFEQVARWKMRELTTRANLEPGPELNTLLTELWHLAEAADA
ncbi:MAG: hypothetical protein U0992_00680 [Planctomycetaceae bacterium]